MNTNQNSTKQTIYLAGGFKSGWQRKVKKILTHWVIFDPSQHNLSAPKDFTKWDLNAIDNSDVILSYMEASNPGGYSLALESGYAKALGKKIILVESHPSDERFKYFEMMREIADYRFESLDEALQFLNQYNHEVIE